MKIIEVVQEYGADQELMNLLTRIFLTKRNEIERLTQLSPSEYPTQPTRHDRLPELDSYPVEVHEAVASQMVYFHTLMIAGRETGVFNALMSIDSILAQLQSGEARV